MTRWETSRRDRFERVSCVWSRVSPPPPPPRSLSRTTSPPKLTVTGRRWCWTERRSRSTSWTRRDRRTTPPYGTTTSAAARASSASSPSRSWSRSRPRWTSGSVSALSSPVAGCHVWVTVPAFQGADPESEGGRERALPPGRQQVGPGRPAAGQRGRGQGARRAVGRVLRGDVSQDPRQRRQGTCRDALSVPAWRAAEPPTSSPAARANRCSST